jgi:hypothetical protein
MLLLLPPLLPFRVIVMLVLIEGSEGPVKEPIYVSVLEVWHVEEL